MSDQINNQNPDSGNSNILKELSDIKSSLSVNTNETSNIKATVNEIKTTVKEIQNNYITRREHDSDLSAIREEISPIRKFVYGLISVVLLAVIGAVLALVVRQ